MSWAFIVFKITRVIDPFDTKFGRPFLYINTKHYIYYRHFSMPLKILTMKIFIIFHNIKVSCFNQSNIFLGTEDFSLVSLVDTTVKGRYLYICHCPHI